MNDLEVVHNYNVDLKNRIIYFPSDLTENFNPSYVSLFCKNMDLLSNSSKDPITIKMLSIDGGCWYSGMVMYEYIINCPCYVTIHAYSLLCSMGTIVLQAADYRCVCPNMNFMVHYGTDEYSGSHLAVKSYAEFSKNGHNKMIDIYAEKCQHGDFFKEYKMSEVKRYLRNKIRDKGDWWMSAEDCVNYGFADSIIERTW